MNEVLQMKDDREFTALAEEYMDSIYRIAMNTVRCPADAEDVTQNVLLRLYRYGPDFESPQHAKHWLIRVTINEAKRVVSMPWRSREASWDSTIAELLEESADGSIFWKRELLQEVLRLPVKYRLPIYLYYYEGYSVKEIGRLLSRPESTVQTQLARGRKALRAVLEEDRP